MLQAMEEGADLSSLRAAVSAGETLACPRLSRLGWPRPASRCWTGSGPQRCCISLSRTGLMITRRPAPASPLTGYEVQIIVDADGDGTATWCEVGTVGCARANGLSLPRGQTAGCLCGGMAGTSLVTVSSMDEEGYLYFAARNDDMIISARAIISQDLKLRRRLLSHPAVSECGVVGGTGRGARIAIVQAHIVLIDGVCGGCRLWSKPCRITSRQPLRTVQIPSRHPVSLMRCPRQPPARYNALHLRDQTNE